MRYIVVDLEATCWEGVHASPDMEIIEIGAVSLGSSSGPAHGRFASFVRPVVVPRLSDFCTRLTTITQADVEGAEPFPQVSARFVAWIGEAPFVLCSWGAYDLNQLRADCARHGLPMPERFERHINVKKEFARIRGVRPCGMSRALELEGLELVGTHHRGIDDAENIARIAMRILPAIEAGQRSDE